jgi:tetratricopeptide (TPR) repeat protein
LKFRQEKAPIRWPYYPEPDFDAILQGYRTELSTTTLLFPVAGLRCVDAIGRLAGCRLLLLVGDKARSTVAQLEGHDSLSLRLAGSFSGMVNIDAIARWVMQQGGAAAMRTPSYERFDTYCFMLGGIGDGGETEAAFAKHVQCFGPNEFHWIESAIRHSEAQWEPRAMLSLLALSRYDPYLVLRLEPALYDAVGTAGAGERAQFVLALEKSRANIFPPADPWDMPVAIGRLFQTLGEPQAALDCYAESVARHGPRSALAYRISRCHGDLGDTEGAVASLREALELGRREGGAHRED